MAITAPIAYYKLDESSGNASDSVGSNTLTNNNSVAYATGIINNGADFGSTNTNKTLTNSSSLGIDSGNISISAWVKRESSDFMFAVNQQSATSDVSYKIKYESGIKAVRNIAGGAENQTTAQAISISTWAHVVLTYDGSTVRCYVNGGTPQTVASTGTGSGVTSKFTIGADNSSGGTDQFFWDGMVDEVGVWNVALTQDEINKIYNAGRGNAYPLTDNLLTSGFAYWKFDESSGNASDSVGSNTATNVGTATYAAGKLNNGTTLNGSSQYFTFATTPQTGAGSWSVNTWVKTSSSGSLKEFLFWGSNSVDAGIDFYMSSGNKLVANFYGGAGIATSTTSINTGAWVMCSITYDGTNIRVYVNGVLEATGANKAGSLSGTTRIIGADGTPGNYWNGSLDEMGIWTRTLTGAEITSLYNSGSGYQYPFGTAYTLALALGTFTLTGLDTLFRIAWKLIATVQTYALTGLDTTLRLGKGFIAEVATFTLTGISALFRTSAWRNSESKSSSTYTNSSKSSSTWTNRGKNQ